MLKREQLLFTQPNPILRYEGEGCLYNPIINYWVDHMLDEHRILRPGLHFGIIIVPFIGAPVFAKWPAIVPAAYDISILVPLIRALVLFPDGSPIF